jgi:hypothetical protein
MADNSGLKGNPQVRKGEIDWSPIFGYDVFISYNWGDARPYAARLESELRLRDLRCFLDNTDAPPGTALNSTLQKALRRSRVVILLVSKGALRSRWVAEEVKTFAATKRAIIPINLDGSVSSEDAANTIVSVLRERDCIWIDDLDASGIAQSPAPGSVDGIMRSFRYRRANTSRRRAVAAAFVILLAITIVALFQWRKTRAQLIQLQGRQLLINAQNLRRDQPGKVEPIALLALESQLRSPSPEAVDFMRQSVETLAEPPSKVLQVTSKSASWTVSPSGQSMTVVEGAAVKTINLPSGDITKTFAIDAAVEAPPPYLKDAAARPVITISPDANAVAVWNQKKQVVLWNARSGKEVWRSDGFDVVNSIAVANGGRGIALLGSKVGSSTDGSLQAGLFAFTCSNSGCTQSEWPADSDKQRVFPVSAMLSRDGSSLDVLVQGMGGSSYTSYDLIHFEASSLRKLSSITFGLNEGGTPSVVFSPSPGTAAVAMDSKLILTVGEKRIEVPSARNSDRFLFSETGRQLAARGRDGVRIYDVAAVNASASRTQGFTSDDVIYVSPLQPSAFIGQAGGETLLSLEDSGAIEGCRLMTSNGSKLATLWNCASGEAMLRIPHDAVVTQAASLSGSVLTQAGSELQVRPIYPGRLVVEHNGRELTLIEEGIQGTFPRVPVKVSADGTRAVACVSDRIWVWNLADGALIARAESDKDADSIFDSCDIAGENYLFTKQGFRRAHLDLQFAVLPIGLKGPVNRKLYSTQPPDQPFYSNWENYSWAVSPTQPRLYLSSGSAAMMALDLTRPTTIDSSATQSTLQLFQQKEIEQGEGGRMKEGFRGGPPRLMVEVAVSGDGRRMAQMYGRVLTVWNADAPGSVPLYARQLAPSSGDLVFAPNHSLLAVRTGTDKLSVVETATGNEVTSIPLSENVETVRFDNSGSYLAVLSKNQETLFASRTGKIIKAFARPASKAPAGQYPSVIGQFDGNRFTAFSGTDLVSIDLESGQPAWSRSVGRVSLCPDGRSGRDRGRG